jgi:hypothetical protein
MSNTERALVWAILTPVAVGCVSAILFAISLGAADTAWGFLIISGDLVAISITFSLPLSFAVCTLIALPLYFLRHRLGIGSLKLYLAAAFIGSLALATAARVLVAGLLAALVFWRTAETPLRR